MSAAYRARTNGTYHDLSLFDAPRARNTDPQTSRDAAGKVWAGWADRVVQSLAMSGPATDDELCLRLGAPIRKWPSVKTARSRVTHDPDPRKRLIVDTGIERDGQTVWRHRDFGSVAAVDVQNGVL